jgi:hypothetical protein
VLIVWFDRVDHPDSLHVLLFFLFYQLGHPWVHHLILIATWWWHRPCPLMIQLYYDVTMTSCGSLSLECIELVEWQVHVRRHGLIICGISLLPSSRNSSLSECFWLWILFASLFFFLVHRDFVSCSISSEFILTSPKLVSEFILQGLVQKIYHYLHKQF